jgi:hypothetical protein
MQENVVAKITKIKKRHQQPIKLESVAIKSNEEPKIVNSTKIRETELTSKISNSVRQSKNRIDRRYFIFYPSHIV